MWRIVASEPYKPYREPVLVKVMTQCTFDYGLRELINKMLSRRDGPRHYLKQCPLE